MRLRALELQNFRQHADSVIEFGDGITGIIGPNGAGKTTILEAIAWALYGMDAARGKRDTIKFQRAAPRATVRVALDFELAGHRYRVVRGLTTAELYLDGGEMPVANSISAVNEVIQRRIGMSRTEFFNTYFTGQKELSVMTALGPTERAQFLSKVLGYERLRAAQEMARGRRRELNAELTGVEQGMADEVAVRQALADSTTARAQAEEAASEARRRRDAAAAELEAMSAQWKIAEAEQQAHHAAVAELRMREQAVVERTRDVERLTQELATATSAVTESATLREALLPLAALQTEREALDQLASAEGRRAALVDSERAVTEEIARKEERRVIIAEAPQIEETLTTEVETQRQALAALEAALESAHTDWVRDRQEAETKRDALREQYAELRDQRERIIVAGEAGLCPTCQRPIGVNYRALLDTLDTQLDVVKVDGSYWRSRVEQLVDRPATVTAMDEQRRMLQAAVTQLERKLERARVAAGELADLAKDRIRLETRLAGVRADLATLPTGYDAARHAVVRRELEQLLPLEKRLTRLAATAEEEPVLRARLAAVTAAQQALTAEIAAQRRAVDTTAAHAPQWESLRAVADAAGAEAGLAAVAEAKATTELVGATAAVERAAAADAERQRAAARRRELTTARRMHDEVDRTYADLRTDLNFALRPEISELASRFLADLTDGRYDEFELDDQYELVIVEDGLPKPVISGGEEDLANLVLRLAISQMIAERAGQSFSLLILDEIFGSLDEVRRQNVVDLLRRLHDRFEQVILITHIESVRDGCDQVLSVRYDAPSGAARVVRGEDELAEQEALLA